ncbi:hypothetical protein V1527DRAFT_475189, partial [Lipomyces starkeyi]
MQALAMDVWQMLNFPLTLYSLRIAIAARRTGHDSSASNMFFGSLQNLTPWNLTAQLTIIAARIPSSVTFSPIEVDFTYDLDVLADVIRAAHVYLVHPVNVILQRIYPESNICCKSEASEGRGHSRLDIRWTCNNLVFAVLEFMLPYSIIYSEWQKAM